MQIRIHPHAEARLSQRGASEEEVHVTIQSGERFSARFDRIGFRREFPGEWEWLGLQYAIKQVTVIGVEESGILVITVIVKFYS